MKKTLRFLSFSLGFLSVPLAFNHFLKTSHVKKITFSSQSFYEWRHGKIRYTVVGSGSPLLLLGGIHPGVSYEDYMDTINAYSKNHTVYALDFLGYGYSDKPDITYSAYLYVTLIIDFIRDIICKKTDAVAIGYAANFVSLAANFDKTLFNKIILISPQYNNKKEIYPNFFNSSLRSILYLPVFGTFIYNLVNTRPIGKFFSSGISDVNTTTAQYKLTGGKSALASYFSKYLNTDIDASVKKITNPILYISSRHRNFNFPSNVKCKTLSGCGNFSDADFFASCFDECNSFLNNE